LPDNKQLRRKIMSFFSDLIEGNWGSLGTDITHATSSFAAHPQEQLEVGLGAAAIAAPFILPEIGAGLGFGGAVDAAAGGGLAADLGIGDIGAAASADVLGSTAADFGFLGGGGADVLAAGGESALGFGADTALTGDTGLSSFLADTSLGVDGAAFNTTGPGIGADVTGDPAVSQFASPAASSGAGEAPAAAGPSATPAGFASTDAELAGATTGTAPAAAATATPTAATGGGGVTGALGSTLSSPWTKLALGAAPLALSLGMGQQQLPTSAQQLQGQATALSQQGQADLASARAGKLNAGQTAVIGQVRTDLTNQWRQTLFNQGVQDPTKDARWPQIEAAIDSQVTQQTAQLIQQNITNALAETGQASAALTSIANMQFQADANFTNSLINATKSLGLAAGSGQTITLKAA
jgi:hypothetical protein